MATQGNWDFYMCRLDDKPAFIFLPLELVKDPPLARYPHLFLVRLHFLHPIGRVAPDDFARRDRFHEIL